MFSKYILVLIFFLCSTSTSARAADDSMTFVIDRSIPTIVVEGNPAIYADGVITMTTSEEFDRLMEKEKLPSGTEIYLNSPGGSYLGGLHLGQSFRQHGVSTYLGRQRIKGHSQLPALCASACAYAFAGGIHRYFYGNQDRLGVHQFYLSGDNKVDLGDAQLISSVLVSYLQTMGVDPALFSAASQSRRDEILWLTDKQALNLHLSDNGKAAMEVSIDVSAGQPYLKIVEDVEHQTNKILIVCLGNKLLVKGGFGVSADWAGMVVELAQRNYFESKTGNVLPLAGSEGVTQIDAYVWLDRIMARSDMYNILKGGEFGVWVDGPDKRFGFSIVIAATTPKIKDFLDKCSP